MTYLYFYRHFGCVVLFTVKNVGSLLACFQFRVHLLFVIYYIIRVVVCDVIGVVMLAFILSSMCDVIGVVMLVFILSSMCDVIGVVVLVIQIFLLPASSALYTHSHGIFRSNERRERTPRFMPLHKPDTCWHLLIQLGVSPVASCRQCMT